MTERSVPAPLLPIIAPPFPDEILGSWLARIRLENGGGAWRALLEHIGYGRKLDMKLFDAVNYSVKLEKLLTYLGVSYEQALLELTTLPYWLTFSATDSGAILQGTIGIPALRRKSGSDGEISSITMLGSQRLQGKAPEFRFCPHCLSEDCDRFGQPYWHRAHQLPNVFFCHKHLCQTYPSCPKCNARPSATNAKVLALPSLRCSCGFAFERAADTRLLSSVELRLIQTSVEALNQGIPRWHRDNVLDFIKTKLRCRGSSPWSGYKDTIEGAFAAVPTKWSNEPTFDKEEKLRFRRYLVFGSAPECCAVLAALDIDIDTATAGFSAANVENAHRSLVPKAFIGVMTVEKSRLALIKQSNKIPARSPSAERKHYWFLVLNDLAWLRERFPLNNIPHVPSILEDREDIARTLVSTKGTQGKIWTAVRVSTAGTRAAFRDTEWFKNEHQISQQGRTVFKSEVKSAVIIERAATLQRVLDEAVQSLERPSHIYWSRLGARVGLTLRQVGEVLTLVPELTIAIKVANQGKVRRQVLWALKNFGPPADGWSKATLAKAAGISNMRVTDEIFAEAQVWFSTNNQT